MFFHIVVQITQECPFCCKICLRHYVPGSRSLSAEAWEEIIDILRSRGLKRLTVTGGEPMILGPSLLRFLKYAHLQKIHTSLSTTGYGLRKELVQQMNEYIDHILVSIRALSPSDWKSEFGDTDHTLALRTTVMNLLSWVQATDIIMEVNTVVHKENFDKVLGIGHKLLELNPNWTLAKNYELYKESR